MFTIVFQRNHVSTRQPLPEVHVLTYEDFDRFYTDGEEMANDPDFTILARTKSSHEKK